MRFNPLEHRVIFMQAQRLTFVNAWAGHIPFAFFLPELTRPRTLVELGTHTGVSYCAFCPGVRRLNFPTRCFSIYPSQRERHIENVPSTQY
jgi:O-antigen biosynthesis protein